MKKVAIAALAVILLSCGKKISRIERSGEDFVTIEPARCVLGTRSECVYIQVGNVMVPDCHQVNDYGWQLSEVTKKPVLVTFEDGSTEEREHTVSKTPMETCHQ